jgi:hypothetical protein
MQTISKACKVRLLLQLHGCSQNLEETPLAIPNRPNLRFSLGRNITPIFSQTRPSGTIVNSGPGATTVNMLTCAAVQRGKQQKYAEKYT